MTSQFSQKIFFFLLDKPIEIFSLTRSDKNVKILWESHAKHGWWKYVIPGPDLNKKKLRVQLQIKITKGTWEDKENEVHLRRIVTNVERWRPLEKSYRR